MSTLQHLVKAEWRYWKRTRLAFSVLAIGALLTLTSVIINGLNVTQNNHARAHLQESAEARFLEQPDRHPHRMVHYGHYAFRTPSPLSVVDPGVDAFVGTTIFLEGHRQNSAMFSEQRQSSGLTRFSSVTPSFLLQTLAPLLIILIGYANVTREKEAGTLNILVTQGTPMNKIVLGKTVALFSAGAILLIPLLVASLWAYGSGEGFTITLAFVLGYLFYVLIWAILVTTVSGFLKKGSTSLVVLCALWIVSCILIPRIASSTAVGLQPSIGKLESDFAVLEELRKLGDGHNASDPAFNKLKANLLAQYDVNDVADLPVNFRGVVAQYSEEKLTHVLNHFAETRMQEELAQAQTARLFGWLSPAIAIRSYSMRIAGSSIETHHRFLREAEALRFEFVQGLNKTHQEVLDYDADINRYKSAETQKKARIDASNWKLLSEFKFEPDSPSQRLSDSHSYLTQLIFWGALAIAGLLFSARRVTL